MENGNGGHQHNFLVKCEEASNLVNNFLNDTLPLGLVPERRKDYIYDEVRRQKVKEKIHKSLQVFDKAIEIHGYVILYFPEAKHATLNLMTTTN